QTLWLRTLAELVAAQQNGAPLRLNELLVKSFRAVLQDAHADPALRAHALALPDIGVIVERQTTIDVPATYAARDFLRAALTRVLQTEIRSLYEHCRERSAQGTPAQAAATRVLKNTCLDYLLATDCEAARAL